MMFWLLFVVLYVKCICGDKEFSQVDLNSLQIFYDATNGRDWVIGPNVPWNFDQPDPNPCLESWYGIKCCLDSANVSHVLTLQLDGVNLRGTVPSMLNLSLMTKFSLPNNFLYGTLPDELFASLETIDLSNNFFNGSIPSTISQYTELSFVDFSGNSLTGVLPSTLSTLPKLSSFIASNNLLIGPLPNELSLCTYLWELTLAKNLIGGPIPQNLSDMTRLHTLNLAQNRLTGPFPALNNPMPLVNLYLEENRLTGPLPDNMDVDTLYQLINLNLAYNDFSGTIPESLQLHWLLTEIVLTDNHFHGSLLDSDGAFVNTEILDLSYNQLTGSIPSVLSDRYFLVQLILEHNHLEGCLTPVVASVNNLAILSLSHNHLTGSIPGNYGGIKPLLVLGVDNNVLSGSVPRSLAQLISLQVLFLASNVLTGNLGSIFNSTVQHQLMYVDVSKNQFTGDLPKELFSCPSLKTFTALSNCFSGPLPVEMCGASNLTSLVLDGLMSASSCQKRFFKNFDAVVSYGLTSRIPDGIPECLFSMPKLSTLHLSGNGLTGSLPSDITLGPALSYLILSHNSLRGDIPAAMRMQEWSSLDVSYNKITGTLEPPKVPHSSSHYYFPSNASLTLKVNRLSGKIHSTLRSLDSINILNGNIFECDAATRKSLPPSDPDFQIYSCGSNSFNDSLYLWCAVFACFLVGLAVVYLFKSRVDGGVRESLWGKAVSSTVSWVNVFSENKHLEVPHIKTFCNFLGDVRTMFVWLTLFIVCVLLPTYLVLSEYYDTYTHEYAWSASGAYLSGVTPAVIMFVLLLAFGMCVIYGLVIVSTPVNDCAGRELKAEKQSERYLSRMLLVIVVLWNMILVTGVNIAYVYIVHHYSSTVVQVTQLFVALFKVTWNNFIVSFVLKNRKDDEPRESLQLESSVRNTDEGVADNDEWKVPARSVRLAVFVMLFNNIAAPFIATGYESSNCFYDIVTTPKPVSVTYSYARCTNFASFTNVNQCFDYDDSFKTTVSYPPPFLYSYQCASTFITTYANIFILMLTIDSFFVPLLLWVMKFSHGRIDKQGKFPLVLWLLDNSLPKLLLPYYQLQMSIFKSEVFVVKLINIFSILCTFGVVLPPVAVICCATVFCTTYQAQLLIGRFVVKALKCTYKDNEKTLIFILNKNCEGVVEMFSSGVQVAMPFASVFFAMLLFDTLGDAVGWLRAICMPVLVCCLPVILYVLYWRNRNSNTYVCGVFDLWGGRRIFRRVSKDTGLSYKLVQHPPEYSPLADERNDSNRSENCRAALL